MPDVTIDVVRRIVKNVIADSPKDSPLMKIDLDDDMKAVFVLITLLRVSGEDMEMIVQEVMQEFSKGG